MKTVNVFLFNMFKEWNNFPAHIRSLKTSIWGGEGSCRHVVFGVFCLAWAPFWWSCDWPHANEQVNVSDWLRATCTLHTDSQQVRSLVLLFWKFTVIFPPIWCNFMFMNILSSPLTLFQAQNCEKFNQERRTKSWQRSRQDGSRCRRARRRDAGGSEA